jgi:hypothetical protein
MVTVPSETGTFHAINWILQHRLRPLIEERSPNGQLVRDRLSHVVLVTTYWDTCPPSATVAASLPTRAWFLQDYLGDVAEKGMTDYNRNYALSAWKALFPASYIVRDRPGSHVRRGLLQWIGLEPRLTPDEGRQERLKSRRTEFLEDAERSEDPAEVRDLEEMLSYLHDRKIDTTIVLFPLVREAVTDEAKDKTLGSYERTLDDLAQRWPFRRVDMSLNSPLVLGDFEPDLDHVTPAGNRTFAAWALGNGLSFLLAPTDISTARTAQGSAGAGS